MPPFKEKKNSKYCLGVDGCVGGWLVVCVENGDFEDAQAFFLPNLLELRTFASSFDTEIVIDIPIGLENDKPSRICDIKGRKYLGVRSSTIFSPPCKDSLLAEDYTSAQNINLKRTGVSISKQSWFLSSKILEAQEEVLNGIELKEGHPECSFAAFLGNIPIKDKKKSLKGIIKRVKCVTEIGFQLDKLTLSLPDRLSAKIDDLLDAAILSWTATRIRNDAGFCFYDEMANVNDPSKGVIYV